MPETSANSKAERVAAFLSCATSLDTTLQGNPLGLDDVAMLDCLMQQEGICSRDLSQACGISLTACTRHMAQLVSLDLVAESVSRADLRKNSFRLTTKGTAILFEIGKAIDPGISEFAEAYRNLRTANLQPQLGFTEQRILLALSCEDGQPVRNICAQTGLAQPKASMALSRLSKSGLAGPTLPEPATSCRDKRLRTWQLTESGAHTATSLARAIS